MVGMVCGMMTVPSDAGLLLESGMNELVVASLLAGSLQVGEPGMIGVEYTVAPGWHIYWENPGQSGIPTEVSLGLPEGWEAGETLYPGPHWFMMPGDLVNYGYEGTVTLLVPVTVATPPAGTITAETRWLVCREEQCVPGRASLELPLPAEAALDVDTAQQHLPAPVPSEAVVQRSEQGLVVHLSGVTLSAIYPNTIAEPFIAQTAISDSHARVWLNAPPQEGSALIVQGEQDGVERFYRIEW